jgi:hypothetical protein
MFRGFSFVLSALVLLTVTFIVGAVIGLTGGVVTSIAGVFSLVWHVLVKFSLVAVCASLVLMFVARNLLGRSMRSLFASMHDRAPIEQENLSPALVLGGVLIAVGQVFAFAHASTFGLYFYEALTKGSLGLGLGIITTMMIARLVGITSTGYFLDMFDNHANNQLVLFLMMVLNVVVFIAMLS